MTNPITREEVAERYELKRLTSEQASAVCQSVHEYMAHTGFIAYSYDYLMVGGGNFVYYAGMERETPELSGPDFILLERRSGSNVEDMIDDLIDRYGDD